MKEDIWYYEQSCSAFKGTNANPSPPKGAFFISREASSGRTNIQRRKSSDAGNRFIKATEDKVTDAHPWALATFCVEVPEGAPKVGERLKHSHDRMLRLRPDGSKLTWSVAAMERFGEPGRAPKPFFITWDDPSMRPDKVGTSDYLLSSKNRVCGRMRRKKPWVRCKCCMSQHP